MSATGEFEITISDLDPGTAYHFRAYAKGEGYNYGIDMTFITLKPPTVATIAATGITPSNATLNGNLIDLGTAADVIVSFEYGLTKNYGNTTAPQTMAAPDTFSASIGGLDLGTTYHFRAVATGDDTSYGDDMTFNTLKLLQVDIKGATVAHVPITNSGLITANITAVAADGSLSLGIAENTIALNKLGECLTKLTVDVLAKPPEIINVVGPIYDFSPRGATFDPPITLTISYAPEQLPYKVTEESLYIGFFDGTKWIPLKSMVDSLTNTVTVPVSHFTKFALLHELLRILSVSSLAVKPKEVEPAGTVGISLLTSNIGNTPGTFDVILKINGAEESTRQVTLDPGEYQVVTFSVAKTETAIYTVDINGLHDSYDVREKQAPIPPPPVEKTDYRTTILTVVLITAGLIITSLIMYFLVIRRLQI